MPPSLWAASASAAPQCSTFVGRATAEAVVIGGGFTGLSTALRLAEVGCKVILLEAVEIGWGASGRNGGQVNPGCRLDPPDILRRYSEAAAERLIEFVGGAPDVVFDTVRTHEIDCEAIRPGWLQPAHNRTAVAELEARTSAWADRGVAVKMLDWDSANTMIGSNRYVGALLDPRGGSVHPLSYARGLARAALRLGAQIHVRSPVRGLSREGASWRVTTKEGSILTDRVVIGTNGYTDGLIPNLNRTLVAVNSFQIATERLPPHLTKSILPGLQTASDTRRLVLYFRKTKDGRLVIGGRGKHRSPKSPNDFDHLHLSLLTLFPQLHGQPIEYRWSGRVAMTADGVPHVHEPESGLVVALGYNGRGIAMGTAMGRAIASYLGGDASALPFPISSIYPIPFHGLRRAYIGAATALFMALDTL
jgi:glycine/D-amino acid oxidase-like deaminating enzyme